VDGGVINSFPIEPLRGRCDVVVGHYVTPLRSATRNELGGAFEAGREAALAAMDSIRGALGRRRPGAEEASKGRDAVADPRCPIVGQLRGSADGRSRPMLEVTRTNAEKQE
jgi:hypothetical protein